VPYYYAGMKAYDVVAAAGGGAIGSSSRFVGARESLADFPTLAATRGGGDGRRDGDGDGDATGGGTGTGTAGPTLKGTIVFTDGQFDDARMGVALACTASAAGATVANYVRVNSLIRDERTGRVVGARCVDVSEEDAEEAWDPARSSSSRRRRGREFEVRAEVVVNATGPFTDGVRRMSADAAARGGGGGGGKKKSKTKKEEDASVPETIMTPAGGVHVALPGHFAPANAGLIVPKARTRSSRRAGFHATALRCVSSRGARRASPGRTFSPRVRRVASCFAPPRRGPSPVSIPSRLDAFRDASD
jgi:glycerol-3-phosphate dehydrogenase